MKVFDKVTRKDMAYWVLILLLMLVAVLSKKFGDDNAINDTLNFAATVVSIILGVIAILYTLMDSTGQKESVNTLTNVANTLSEQTEKLSDSISENQILLDKMNEINENITSQRELFKEELIATKQEILEGISSTEDPQKVAEIIESKFTEMNNTLISIGEHEIFPNSMILMARHYIKELNIDKIKRRSLERRLAVQLGISPKKSTLLLKQHLPDFDLYYDSTDDTFNRVRTR
ncbi:hypothetical protein ERX35_007905 [Macrococcus equipercicus]|uniref:LemA family protein n=1 Tax=Macrococcus equipercicus TaxID=69967 RepID=A0ABQ6R7Q5_9STAP|nr:hypothetical protein [Macrococcus equipercicus]KAA1039129.1 hypothetical protein ERX35_007905 [Macrococcus equipercicus]